MRVLVTRPQPGADTTARRLTALGHEPVVLPLTRTVALDPGRVPELAGLEAVVATSAAAIRLAPPTLIAAIRGLPLHAVGRKTVEAAEAAGFRDIAPPLVDALSAGLHGGLAAGGRVLYLAGRVRTGAIEERLAASGVTVELVEVYDTVADGTAFATAASLIGEAPLGAALVYSAYGAAMLSRLAVRPAVAAAFGGTRCICISQRVAEALDEDLFDDPQVATSPDERAMLALLGPAA